MKRLDPTKVVVGDNTFYITPFSAMRAARISGDLGAILTPIITVVSAAMGAESSTGSIMDADISDLGMRIGTALSNTNGISGDQIEKLMRQLLLGDNIVVEIRNGNKKDHERLDEDLLDEIFCGEVQDMYILCYEVIKLNYKGFFNKLTDLFGAVGSVTQKQTTPTLEPSITLNLQS